MSSPSGGAHAHRHRRRKGGAGRGHLAGGRAVDLAERMKAAGRVRSLYCQILVSEQRPRSARSSTKGSCSRTPLAEKGRQALNVSS
jgi:hypothetical protein